MKTNEVTFRLVGSEYYKDNWGKINANFKGQWHVTLELEPTNEYDPNAIEVFLLGCKFGYVARHETSVIREFLTNNPEYTTSAVIITSPNDIQFTLQAVN